MIQLSTLFKEAIEKLPSEYHWQIILLAFIIVVISRILKGDFKYFFNFKFERKKSTLELLKSIEEVQFQSGATKSLLKDSLENDIFKKQMGIRTEIELRKSILEFYQANKENIT
jgi:hypothetical protein